MGGNKGCPWNEDFIEKPLYAEWSEARETNRDMRDTRSLVDVEDKISQFG